VRLIGDEKNALEGDRVAGGDVEQLDLELARLDFQGPSPELGISPIEGYSFPHLTLSPYNTIPGFSES
jgi:hypothetical protein